MKQSRDQQRFTVSAVAADWHELMVPQRIMWPSIAVLKDNLTRGAATGHTIVPVTHIRPSSPKLLIIPRATEDRRLSWPEYTVVSNYSLQWVRSLSSESDTRQSG